MEGMAVLIQGSKREPTEVELRSRANAKVFAALLTDYLKQRFKYKLPAVTFGLPTYLVDARRKRYDLYFRVTPPKSILWDSNTLVVARIGFHQERKGHGTDMMAFLVRIAGQVGYTHIGIEQANENATAFGAKLGFTQFVTEKNFLASVEEVRKRLR